MNGDRLREGLKELYSALLALHAALLDAVKADYAASVRPIGGPMDLYQLVLNDPFFAWLRPLSSVLALLDERIHDKRPLGPDDASNVVASARELFEATDPGSFGSNFRNRLDGTATASRYSEVKAALTRMDAPNS